MHDAIEHEHLDSEAPPISVCASPPQVPHRRLRHHLSSPCQTAQISDVVYPVHWICLFGDCL